MARKIKEKLKEFKEEAALCKICRDEGLIYHHSNNKWAFPLFDKNLDCRSGVLAIAEAPNFDDTFDPKKGYLSYDIDTDPTGNFFRDLLNSVGLKVQDVIITNAVLCLPARKGVKFPVTPRQARKCACRIKNLIDLVDPTVVLTMGGKALEAIKRIDQHGLTLKTSKGQLHDWYGRKLLPLYHPSLLGRANRTADLQYKDIVVLKQVL